jgi:hypothetical protein
MANTRFQSVLQVFDAFPAITRDLTSAPTDEPPLGYLAKLLAGPTPEDAVTFCAYLLDRRQAVWWASLCLRHLGMPRDRDEEVALKTAEAWVRDPEEPRRIAALDLGLNGNHDIPAVWVAFAAGMAGGTIRTADALGPPVPPHATARAVRVAILNGIATVSVRDRNETLTACIDMGRRLLAAPE